MKKIRISTAYITLGQFLKFADLISSGGETKFFLTENDVLVNHEVEVRRGRKLFPGDEIIVNSKDSFVITR